MNIDDKIWHSETDYYCEKNDWNSSATTNLPPGTEITIYNDSDQSIESIWFVSKTGKFILYNNTGSGGGGGGSSITIDTAMSDTSTNAVQNKIIKAYADTKQNILTAGDNITISDDNVISASGGSDKHLYFHNYFCQEGNLFNIQFNYIIDDPTNGSSTSIFHFTAPVLAGHLKKLGYTATEFDQRYLHNGHYLPVTGIYTYQTTIGSVFTKYYNIVGVHEVNGKIEFIYFDQYTDSGKPFYWYGSLNTSITGGQAVDIVTQIL